MGSLGRRRFQRHAAGHSTCRASPRGALRGSWADGFGSGVRRCAVGRDPGPFSVRAPVAASWGRQPGRGDRVSAPECVGSLVHDSGARRGDHRSCASAHGGCLFASGTYLSESPLLGRELDGNLLCAVVFLRGRARRNRDPSPADGRSLLGAGDCTFARRGVRGRGLHRRSTTHAGVGWPEGHQLGASFGSSFRLASALDPRVARVESSAQRLGWLWLCVAREHVFRLLLLVRGAGARRRGRDQPGAAASTAAHGGLGGTAARRGPIVATAALRCRGARGRFPFVALYEEYRAPTWSGPSSGVEATRRLGAGSEGPGAPAARRGRAVASFARRFGGASKKADAAGAFDQTAFGFRLTSQAMAMLNVYRPISGAASKIWLNGSGGVMMAETMKAMTMK